MACTDHRNIGGANKNLHGQLPIQRLQDAATSGPDRLLDFVKHRMVPRRHGRDGGSRIGKPVLNRLGQRPHTSQGHPRREPAFFRLARSVPPLNILATALIIDIEREVLGDAGPDLRAHHIVNGGKLDAIAPDQME